MCNSLYLYTLSVNKQIAWVVELQLTIYMVQLIATQYQNNLFSTTMQLHYNCTYDDIIHYHSSIKIYHMALWRFLDIKFFSFQNIVLHHPLWFLMMVWNCDMWHNNFFPHGILIIFWICVCVCVCARVCFSNLINCT
jgi:hypothetical protein